MTTATFILDFFGIVVFATAVHLADLMLQRTGETLNFKFERKHIPYLTLAFFIVTLCLMPEFKTDFEKAFPDENYNEQLFIVSCMTFLSLVWSVLRWIGKL